VGVGVCPEAVGCWVSRVGAARVKEGVFASDTGVFAFKRDVAARWEREVVVGLCGDVEGNG